MDYIPRLRERGGHGAPDLDGLPEFIQRYFDYEALARDLDIELKLYQIGGDIVEVD